MAVAVWEGFLEKLVLDWTCRSAGKKGHSRQVAGGGCEGDPEVSGFLWSAGIPPESWNLFSAVVFGEEGTAEQAGRSQHLGSGHHADSPPSPSGSCSRRAICWLCPRLALSPSLPLAPGLKQAG